MSQLNPLTADDLLTEKSQRLLRSAHVISDKLKELEESELVSKLSKKECISNSAKRI
jgi:hypothetical protein